MIPMTVSYFTKSSKTRALGLRNGVMYGGFITLIYLILGLLAAFTIGAAGLNTLSTDMIFNMVIFVILVVFAFSFFGYFDIALPGSWSTKTDSIAAKGGVVGIFFMAFTLCLVSFSCTGPIAASLMTNALESPVSAGAGMLGFGIALGLPFGLFAAFPGWLQSMPKSGGWMNHVKVFLGHVELALALKFLSTAEQTKHWQFFYYEIFIGIWLIIALLNALYFLGLFRYVKNYAPPRRDKPGNLIMAGLSLLLVGHLAMGFTRSELTGAYRAPWIVSGMAPPTYHAIFPPQREKSHECPIGLSCYRDYFEGMAYAKSVNKPVMVDFTGYGCVNCRKMEELVWVEEDIYKILRDEVVLISLYVDDRAKLEQTLITEEGSKLRTKGAVWAAFEEANFKYNAQPYYVLLSPDEQLLANPVGYTPDKAAYKAWLRCGIDAFRKGQ
jgi:thiol:disulfide interchange protein DsbD